MGFIPEMFNIFTRSNKMGGSSTSVFGTTVKAEPRIITPTAEKVLEAETTRKQADEVIERLVKIQSAVFEKANAYTNLIILAGYAGSLTLIKSTKEFIDPKLFVFSTLLLSVSLFSFCIWEVYKMIFHAAHNSKYLPLIERKLPPAEFFSELDKLAHQEKLSNVRNIRYWKFVLMLTVPTAFLAGGILAFCYIRFLIS